MSTSLHQLSADVRQGTCVVIAAYNEATCIERVVREVREIIPNVIVVDDGSTDETVQAARRSASFVLRHAINRGQGAALQTGIDFALRRGAKYIVTFDADGQHDPADIAAMLVPIVNCQCEITLGSRFLGTAENLPSSRKLMIQMGILFTRLANGVRLTDSHNGFRAFSRRAAEKLNITLDRMAHASELIDQIAASGLPFKEVPVHIRYTEYSLAKGQSSLGAFRIVLHYLIGKVVR
jgi:glycosyltransferase involved in cell wall biosynthesis